MEVEQVTQWGNALNEIDGTVTKKLEKPTLGDDGKPTWSITVSAPVEPPHGFGQPDDVWVNNLQSGLASQLVEGGRYKLKIERQGLRKDPKTGLEGDGTKAGDYWLKLQEVLKRLEATPELQKAVAAAPVNTPSERVYEQMQRDATQREEPTSRVILGAERGNAWNVVQEMITTHIQATGSYPFPTDWNGPDDPESRPMTLEELASLHAEAVELILQHNTASEQKVRF
jgi:hypothetical protein